MIPYPIFSAALVLLFTVATVRLLIVLYPSPRVRDARLDARSLRSWHKVGEALR